MPLYPFITITLLCLILFYHATGKDKRILIVSTVWLLLLGVTAYTGYFENTTARPPRFVIVPLMAIAFSIFCYRRAIRNRPIKPLYLVTIHTLRLPVEVVLYELFLLHQVPVLMTFKGWNFDIIMGISALLILLWLLLTKRKPGRHFMLAWNIAGILCLLNVVVIAVLSSPLPIQQFAFDQPNVAVLQFPYIFLPGFIVPVVLLSHLLLLCKKAIM